MLQSTQCFWFLHCVCEILITGNISYRFSTTYKSYADAKEICEQANARLFEPKTKSSNDKVCCKNILQENVYYLEKEIKKEKEKETKQT